MLPSNGSLTLNLADAPADELQNFYITLTGVSLRPDGADLIEFSFNSPQRINLLDFQGGEFTTLLDRETIPIGSYVWIQLEVGEEQDAIVADLRSGGMVNVQVDPSASTPFRPNARFTMPRGGDIELTMDFDLRSSLIPDDEGGFLLRPELRVVRNDRVGTLSGNVDPTLISTACAESGIPNFNGAVYAFEGIGRDPADLGTGTTDLLVSAPVRDIGGEFRFTLPFLPDEEYKVYYTCDFDRPDRAGEPLDFLAIQPEVRVRANQETVINLMEP